MANPSPLREFLLPRIAALMQAAVATGAAPDVVVAVAIDIITSPQFDKAAPDPMADSEPHADYDRAHNGGVVLVNGTTPANVQRVGVQSEDDFVRPLGNYE